MQFCSHLLEPDFEKAKKRARKKKDTVSEVLEDIRINEEEVKPFDLERYCSDRIDLLADQTALEKPESFTTQN